MGILQVWPTFYRFMGMLQCIVTGYHFIKIDTYIGMSQVNETVTVNSIFWHHTVAKVVDVTHTNRCNMLPRFVRIRGVFFLTCACQNLETVTTLTLIMTSRCKSAPKITKTYGCSRIKKNFKKKNCKNMQNCIIFV